MNVPTHLRGRPRQVTRSRWPRAEHEVVQSRVREKKPSSRAKARRVTFGTRRPGIHRSVGLARGGGERRQPRLLRDREKKTSGRQGWRPGWQAQGCGGRRGGGAAATEEDEGDDVEGPREAEGGRMGVDWRSGGHGNGADLPFNLTSLLPSSLAAAGGLQENHRESDLFEERYPPLGGKGDDDTGATHAAETRTSRARWRWKVRLSLSSFGTVWNF